MAKKITLNEIADMLAHVIKHMATKDDIAELRTELKGDIASVRDQASSIEKQLTHARIETRIAVLFRAAPLLFASAPQGLADQNR